MMKKVFLMGVILLTIVGSSATQAYTDVEGHWAEKEITNLSLNGIVSGYADNSFHPNQSMTRAELVTIINRMLGNTVQNTKYVPDINAKDWFYKEVRKGLASGYIEGDANGYLRPREFITREEAIVMLQRAFMPAITTGISHSFEDEAEISAWSRQAINTFWRNQYLTGYPDNTIRPKAYVTRAEVVKMITNMVDVFATFGTFSGEVHGNILVSGKNVTLKNITITGDVIVTEGTEGTLTLENIIIQGNLIRRAEVTIPNSHFVLKGTNTDIRVAQEEDNDNYINDEYGIRFSIPQEAQVIYIEDEQQKVNYRKKNLMTLRIQQDDSFYFKPFDTMVFQETSRFDVPYSEMEQGKIGIYDYAVYGSERDKSYFFYLKRDNVQYVIYFYNIDNINVIDSLVNSVQLYEGTYITPHEKKIYRNPDLYLKFSYLDYVTVDDSYNTGVVNEEEGFFKMFIQVNNIIDMSDYSVEELKEILSTLEDPDGTILSSEIKKVYTYDAIEYTVRQEDKLVKSLYVMIPTKLYHFIFVGEESQMDSIGTGIYNDIINSIEF